MREFPSPLKKDFDEGVGIAARRSGAADPARYESALSTEFKRLRRLPRGNESTPETMTPPSDSPSSPPAEPTETVDSDGSGGDSRDEGRSERARSEPMTIRPLRDGRYVVETDGGTYVVALDAGTCTCPDHAIRGARCKHLRRVATAVTDGSVPAPDERVGVCAVCGGETFVSFDASGPQLCARHGFETGDVVRDRETDERLVVVAITTKRADAVRTDDGRLVAEYPTNAAYGRHEPVVKAVYVDSLRPGRGIADCKRYEFPASRLTKNA